MWSDEKLFVVDHVPNLQNRRVLVPKADVNVQAVMRSKHPASVMVFGLLASDGKAMPPLFIPKGVKMTGSWYRDNVLTAIEDWCLATYGPRWRAKVTLMQDGAPCHTAQVVQRYLATNWGEESFW